MSTISIAPGKNNVGAYINDINLSQLNDQLSNKIKTQRYCISQQKLEQIRKL